MKKSIITIFLFFFTFIWTGFSQNNRGLSLMVKQLDPRCRAGKQYVLLIAIDNYRAWPPLKNPVRDARELRQVLTSRYYIDEVTELYNEKATKANIIKAFESYQGKLSVFDSLLVYYAGHGHMDNVTNSGFWIPVNAGLDKYEQSNWLPNTQIRGIVAGIKAIHFLIISDSCFSGDLLNSSRARPDDINSEYFRKAYMRNSRQILTSGASETVPDQSEFSRMLKIALMKNTNPYLDPLMLFSEIRLGVRKTMPMFGNLKDTGHQEGASFLFFLKEEKKREESRPAEIVTARTEEKKAVSGEKKPAPAVDDSAGKNGFVDEFVGPALDKRWRWVREHRDKWDIHNGVLSITAEPGALKGILYNSNLLLTESAAPDFTLETKLTFLPSFNVQEAGLLVYKDAKNYVQLVFKFKKTNKRAPVEVGRFFEFGAQSGKKYDYGMLPWKPDGDTTYLRIQKTGNVYKGYVSTDGKKYNMFTSYAADLGVKPRIGLFAGLFGVNAPEISARFDYIRVMYQETDK